MRYLVAILAWVLSLLFTIEFTVAENATSANVEEVRTIDWTRFASDFEDLEHLRTSGQILLNSARWGCQWVVRRYKLSAEGDRFSVPNKNAEHVIRPPSSVAVGLATIIKTGLADDHVMGIPEKELIRREVALIKGVASVHKANGGAWGEHWQSSLWAALLGRAGWMMWDEMDEEARQLVYRVVEFEADRHIRKGYKVPHWNGRGGDSKAEENSWEALILQLAVAMMPNHPNATQWKTVCSELQISAYARKSDMSRTQSFFDGKSPKQWLRGYNLREDGIVINHGRIHNDYMVCIGNLQMQGFIVFSLADAAVPETTDFNFEIVYKTLVNKHFESPPYLKPGGTMYVQGKPDVYYPQGTDWSVFRFDIFHNMDAYAAVLKYDARLAQMAEEWMRLRGEKILQMQSRHKDGHIYASGEFDRYSGSEQLGLWMLADSYLLRWLAAKNALSMKGNWLGGKPAQ